MLDYVKRHQKLVGFLVVLFSLILAMKFSVVIVKAQSGDVLDKYFEMMGTTEEDFLGWGWNKISDCLGLMDDGMKSFGVDSDLKTIFDDTTNDTLKMFEDVETEEDAYDILKGLMGID